MAKKAIIAGASGLIGSELLQLLLQKDTYDQILIITRRELPVKHAKLKQLVIDFEYLDTYAGNLKADVIFSCLGTTQSQTPDKTLYRKIDHDYPVKLAQIGLQNGAAQFHLISSVGANANSSTFYLRLKGETERDVAQSGIPSIFIYQPSMLRGRHQKKRFLEQLIMGFMKIIDPILLGGLEKYHSIHAADIALAMYNQSIDNQTGTYTYQYKEIKKLT